MANENRREQIAKQIKLQKITEIHKHFDKDNDGYLNYAELSSLQSKTTKHPSSSGEVASENKNGNNMPRSKYKTICAALGCKPNKGLDLRALILTYESGGGANADDDYDTVFGIKRTKKKDKQISTGASRNGVQANVNIPENTAKTTIDSHPQEPKSEPTSPTFNLIGLLKKGSDPIITRACTTSTGPPEIMDFIVKQRPHTVDEPQNLGEEIIQAEKAQMRSKDRSQTDSTTIGDIDADGGTILHLDVHVQKPDTENVCQCLSCTIM
jgi:hypothetical protein